MLVSKESGHHGMNAFDHRTPSIPEEISEHPPVMVFGDASQPRSFARRSSSAACIERVDGDSRPAFHAAYFSGSADE